MVGKIVALLFRLIVAAVFLYAGVMKIWDFQHGHSATPDFVVAIQHFEILPHPDLAVMVAVYLPWLEVISAVALFLRRLALGAAMAIAGMTAIFLIALASAWHRGLDISCGCFGKDEVSINYPTLLMRDGALLAAALALLWWEWRTTASAPASEKSGSSI